MAHNICTMVSAMENISNYAPFFFFFCLNNSAERNGSKGASGAFLPSI